MKYLIALVVAVFVWVATSLAVTAVNPAIQVYETRAEFTETRQNLIDAIIGHGYVIDFNGHVGDMLKRTQDDLGGKQLYHNAEYMVFCSASMSRKMMEADIHNIGFCPFVITVYETSDNPGTIYVAYQKLNSDKNMSPSLIAINEVLDQIAREATE